MTRFALVLFMLSLGPAFSFPVSVQSGDHPTFTRLVLEFADTPVWTLRRNGSSVTIDVEGAESYELSGVFQKVSKDRLETVSSDGSSMVLGLRCACEVTAERFGARRVIIDIHNPGQHPLAAPKYSDETRLLSGSLSIDLPLSVPGLDSGYATTDAPSFPKSGIPDPAPGMRATEAFLLDGLERALAQDLVDATSTDPIVNTEPASIDRLPNVSTITSVERDLGFDVDRTLTTKRGHVCHPDRDFRVADWIEGAPMDALVVAQRAALAEGGGLTPSGRISLAQTLVALGLGSEAIGLLADTTGPTAERLRALARVVEGVPSAWPGWADQLDCESDVALWATLAAPEEDGESLASFAAVATALSDLPPHLMALLGPRLTDRYLAANDLDAAADIHAILARSDLVHLPQARLSAAALALRRDDPNALGRLDALAEGTSLVAAKALAISLRARLSGDQPVADFQLQQARALARALGNRPEAQQLNALTLEGLLRLAAIGPALELLNGPLPPNTRSRLAGLILSTAAASDTETFLTAYLSVAGQGLTPFGDYEVAKRLLEVGLFEDAQGQTAAIDDVTARRDMEVRLALTRGRPIEATDPDLDEELAVAAFLAAEDASRAALTLLEHGRNDEALRLALAAGDWDTAIAADTALQPVLGALATQPTPLSNADALEHARGLRQSASDLLAIVTPTD